MMPMTATVRPSVWDLVIEHVNGRRASLSSFKDDVVDHVIADMRLRTVAGQREPFKDECVTLMFSHKCDHLIDAYEGILDFVARLAAVLDEHGVTLDEPISNAHPSGWRLIRVQAMLWDHVRTVMQLRAMIQERDA